MNMTNDFQNEGGTVFTVTDITVFNKNEEPKKLTEDTVHQFNHND
jgi:hypothetical protein